MKSSPSFVFFVLAGIALAQDDGDRVSSNSSLGGLLGSLFGGLFGALYPLVNSRDYQRTVSLPALIKHADKLMEFSQLSNGTRAYGSAGHNATTSYIKRLLDRTGYYKTEFQSFPYLYWEGSSAFSVDGTDYETGSFTYGPAGVVTAPLVLVNDLGCELTDFPESVAGNIAFIKRGNCEFGHKVSLAGAAGAAGAIIFNNAPGSLSATLSQVSRPTGPYVPVGGLNQADGDAIAASLAAGTEVVGTLNAVAHTEERWSSNVIATTKLGDQNNIVMAGAHSDSVPAGPGINDNGSGSIGLLELALALPRFRVKNAVRFAWWTAEEIGLVGSRHYVTVLTPEEKQKIALYLNFDMIASPNAGYFILDGNGDAYGTAGPAGSDHIEKTFEEYFVRYAPVKSAPTAFSGRSDYGPFLEVGIPSGGLQTGAEGLMTDEEAKLWNGEVGVAYDKCYHQKCDTIENLNRDALVTNTKGAAHAIAVYANSLTGIPRDHQLASSLRVSTQHVHVASEGDKGCAHVEEAVL